MKTSKTCKVTTNGVELPANVQSIVNKVNGISSRDARIILSNEIDFLVCDLRQYHGNYNHCSAWISGKSDNSFTVNFSY